MHNKQFNYIPCSTLINLSLIFARNTRIQNYTREREKEKGSLDDGLASTPAEGRSVKAVA